MKTYVKPGFFLTLAHTAAVESGQAIKVGTQIVVASGKYAANEEGEYLRGGVHVLPKASGAITVGAALYWDDTNKNLTTTLTSNTFAGTADAAAASGDATVAILLNNIPYKYS